MTAQNKPARPVRSAEAVSKETTVSPEKTNASVICEMAGGAAGNGFAMPAVIIRK